MGPRVMDTGTLTTIALALIVVFAVLTVIGILWGAHLKRQRVAAERIEELVAEQDRKAAERQRAASEQPARAAEPAPVSPPPLPVAPPPPPLAPEPPVIVEPVIEEPAAEEPSIDPAPFADEPIVAAAPLEASPAAEAAVAQPPAPPAPPPAPPVTEGPPPGDGPITQLKGLGPKLAERLAELGITTVGQLAALDTAQAEALDARLGPFTGRMNRDRWIEQARFLAAGDRAGFEAVFGKL
ncbi:MAG: hypothetical protein P0Y64_10495 [Candidatus Sphingomonas colombiensis]|nr:hypothetical protein [Sphingomonas sp.]WEK41837.1 MAG: hypothetical protein P0Y64_10495 [Sphingomonas sp.]